MKIVCIGDSLTYGYGVYSNENWVELLRLKFNIEIINKGVNGDTTAGIISRSSRDIIELAPSHMILMAGTNDILLNYPVNNVIDNAKFLLNEAEENSIIPIIALQPTVVPELAKIYWDQYIDYDAVNEHLKQYIDSIKTFASKNNIGIINFYDSFLGIEGMKDLYRDGIHPNAQGHELMFKTIIASKILTDNL